MKKNFLLFLAVIAAVLLGVNSFKRILSFRTTAGKVTESQMRLDKLKAENEALKNDLNYKKSDNFAEGEIRNKLGLAKDKEAIVIVPKKDDKQPQVSNEKSLPNWKKWWNLFFGS